MDIKELVKAFNLNNYACNKINTNFTVEGKKIVGLFASGANTKEYLRGIREEIIRRHYSGGSKVASEHYNLNYFPFVLNSGKEKYTDEDVKKVELADSTNSEVIRNLKLHFINEFNRVVALQVIACLQKVARVTEEVAHEWIRETIEIGAIGKPYLYCIAFSNEYLKREYDLETFEFFKQAYIKEFNSRLENCGLKSSDFYEYKDDMLYVKNVSDKVIKSVTEYVEKEVAFDFRTPGTEDSKVENFKDVLGDSIFKLIGKSINAYGYDIFTDKKKIENGNNFVLIPLTERYSGQLESLKHKDMYKTNIKYKNLMSDIRGKTADPDITNSESPIYAISNKRIAQLLPKIMESPIAYNQINGRFEFAVDPENFKRHGSSRFSSTVTSPTHAGQSGLRTPPEQTGDRFFESKGSRDSGIGESPPKPEDSGSSSGGPGSLVEQPQVQPRQGSMLLPVQHHVGAAANMPARTSAWSSSASNAGLWSFPQSEPSSSKGANKSGPAGPSGSLSAQQSFSEPLRFSSSGPRFQPYVPKTAYSVDSGRSRSPRLPQLIPPPPPLIPSSGSVPGSRPPVSFASTRGSYSSPPPLIPISGSVSGFRLPVPFTSASSRWSLQSTSGNKWIPLLQFTEPGFSGSLWTQSSSELSSSSSPVPSAGLCPLPQSGPSSNERPASVRSEDSDYSRSPPLTLSISNVSGSSLSVVRSSSSEGASERRTSDKPLTEEEKELIKALLYVFNFCNYTSDVNHTNFTLENGKIVSLLGVDKKKYLWKVRNDIIKRHCGTEEEARKVYDLGQLPFVFPPDSNYEEDKRRTVLAYNIRDAVFNLKIHLIQEFKKDVEEKVIKKLVEEMKMIKREAYECIRRSVHLEKVNNPTSYLCDISFSNEYFQNQPELSNELEIDVETLFKEFKNIYVEEFKSRLKECGLGDSLVSHEGNILHIKNAIDIDVIKKIKECRHKEVPVKYFPLETVIMEIPIGFKEGENGGGYILDTSFALCETQPPLKRRSRLTEEGTSKAGKTKPEGQDSGIGSSGDTTDAGKGSSEVEEETRNRCSTSGPESMDCKELSSTQQQSPWSEDEGSSSESSRSDSSSKSDGKNTGKGSPKPTLELSMGMEELAISTDLDATKAEQHSPIKKFRSN